MDVFVSESLTKLYIFDILKRKSVFRCRAKFCDFYSLVSMLCASVRLGCFQKIECVWRIGRLKYLSAAGAGLRGPVSGTRGQGPGSGHPGPGHTETGRPEGDQAPDPPGLT